METLKEAEVTVELPLREVPQIIVEEKVSLPVVEVLIPGIQGAQGIQGEPGKDGNAAPLADDPLETYLKARGAI